MQQRSVIDRFDSLLERIEELDQEQREKELDALFGIDVLVALRWTQEAWDKATSAITYRCWKHMQVLDEGVYELIDSFGRIRMQAPSVQTLLQ